VRTSQNVVGTEKGDTPVSKVMKVLDKLARKVDTDRLLTGDKDNLISKIGVVWELTVENLRQMINDGVDLVIVHTYPFSRNDKSMMREERLRGYEEVVNGDTDELKKKLLKEYNLTLLRFHTAWDNAQGGNNDVLAQLLGLTNVESVPLARVGEVKKLSLENYAMKVKRVLNSVRVKVVGKKHKPITKVMVVAGRGLMFKEFVDYCARNKVDVIISGDATKKVARYATDRGVALIDAGARETEVPGMKELAKRLWDEGLEASFYETKELFSYV